ncbi:unnamed protein product [Sphagnum jensenii]|uniref:Uncharacterized protein n=1 Tax=Sphagnum jensenii TaxID=128206 RepID=A0ABP0VTB7_9BRYO
MGEGNVSVAGRWIRHVTGSDDSLRRVPSLRPSVRPPARPSVCLPRSGSNTRSVFLCCGCQFPLRIAFLPASLNLGRLFFSHKSVSALRIWAEFEYCEHVNEHSGTNAICPSELCGSVVDAVPVPPSTPAAHYSSCTRSISTSSGGDSSSGTVTGSCCLPCSSSSAAAAGVPTSPATAPAAASNVLAGSNARD